MKVNMDMNPTVCVNNISHDIKVLMKVINTEMLNIGFT